MNARAVVVFTLLANLASCGGSTSNGASSSGGEDEMGDVASEPVVEHRGSAIESMGITGPDKPWAEMTHEEREWYMVGKVLPVMNELFQRQYGSRYPASGITCETCHGADGRERGFAMPSGHLLPLPAQGTPAAANLAATLPESLQFMSETVTPAMKTLLGTESYSCMGCHTRAP